MLAETSKARMTVPSSRGSADHRLRAGQRDARGSSGRRREHAAGMRRRQAAGRAAPAPAAPRPARARRRAERRRARRRRRSTRAIAARPRAGQQEQRAASAARGTTSAQRRPPPAQRGHAHDRRGRGRRRSRGTRASTPARLNAAAMAGSRAIGRLLEPLPEARVVGVDVELLAGLGVLHDQRPDVRQLDLARVDRAGWRATSWRRFSRSSGRSQPGALMKSETTNTSERRLIARCAGLEQRRQVGERRARQARVRGAGRRRAAGPGRGRRAAGIVRSTSLP